MKWACVKYITFFPLAAWVNFRKTFKHLQTHSFFNSFVICLLFYLPGYCHTIVVIINYLVFNSLINNCLNKNSRFPFI